MVHSRTRPSDVASAAKRTYIPMLEKNFREFLQGSTLIEDTACMKVDSSNRTYGRPRVTVEAYDPIDCAIHLKNFYIAQGQPERRIVVVNTANEKRPGGDWESGLTAPEECFARRSTLVHALNKPFAAGYVAASKQYPIPQTGGVYSNSVGMAIHLRSRTIHVLTRTVVFRGGGDNYETWTEDRYRALSVISVAPIRGPRLDASGTDYSFPEERQLMDAKMTAVLRIAAYYQCRDICISAFGVGPIFRNPAKVTAEMWRRLLFHEDEFKGAFENVVFGIDTSPSSSSKTTEADAEIFKHVFDPNQLFPTSYR
jgi:uncharacterized protein (TIGR02452 family)